MQLRPLTISSHHFLVGLLLQPSKIDDLSTDKVAFRIKWLLNPYFKDAVDFLTLDIPGVADGLQIQAVPDMDFTSDPYLPGNVMSLLQLGQFDKNIEVIFGNNADEGIFVTGPQTHGFTEWDEYR